MEAKKEGDDLFIGIEETIQMGQGCSATGIVEECRQTMADFVS